MKTRRWRQALWALAVPAMLAAGLAHAQQTLVVAAPQTPTGMDGDIAKVATRQMVVQNYDGLVDYKHVKGPDGRIVLDPSGVEPLLAESWTAIDGGKSYSAQPMIEVVENGTKVEKNAPQELYTHVRWTVLGSLARGAKVTAEFRAQVTAAPGEAR